MPRKIALDLTTEDGTVVQVRVRISKTFLDVRFFFFFLVSVVVGSRVDLFAAAGRWTTHRRARQHRAADARG